MLEVKRMHCSLGHSFWHHKLLISVRCVTHLLLSSDCSVYHVQPIGFGTCLVNDLLLAFLFIPESYFPTLILYFVIEKFLSESRSSRGSRILRKTKLLKIKCPNIVWISAFMCYDTLVCYVANEARRALLKR